MAVQWVASPFYNHGTNNSYIFAMMRKYELSGARILPGLGPGTLTDMPRDAVLIIVGHSGHKQERICENEDLTGQVCPAELLAMILKDSDLNQEHVLIRMMACKSWALARAVATYLGPTHPRIAVAGYLSKVMVEYVPETMTPVQPFRRTLIQRYDGAKVTENVRDSTQVKWFGANGQDIPKPRSGTDNFRFPV